MVRSGEWASPGERVAMATPADLSRYPPPLSLCLCPQGPMMSCSRSCVCSHGTSVEESTWYGIEAYPSIFYRESDNPEGPLVQYTYSPWPPLCWKVRLKE